MISSGACWICQSLSLPIPDALLKTSTRFLFAAGTALLFVLLVGPWFIKKLSDMKVGQPIRDDEGFLLGTLHKSKKNTPTMGGALIVASVLISSLLWADWSSVFVPLSIGALLFFGCIGAFDDMAKLKSKSPKGLPGKLRLVLQTLFALFVIILLAYPSAIKWIGFSIPQVLSNGSSVDWHAWQSGIYFPFVSKPVFIAAGATMGIVFGLQWLTIVGTANAVNLTDGLDGLAAGCAFLASLAMSVAALFSNHQELASSHSLLNIQSSGELAILLAALGGACLGFLWFNAYPAQVFMGDTGSLAIGGMLGTVAVLLKREWLLALIGAIFVIETVSVIVQVASFKKSGKRIFLCTPLHHHFEYAGLHEAKVVTRFWAVGFILAVVGILSLHVQ